MPRRKASNGRALASVLIALVVAALPATGGAQAAKGANEVVDGAKKIGKGVEETGVDELTHHRHRPAERDAPDRRVVLQRGNGLGEIAPELLGVAPVERQRVP